MNAITISLIVSACIFAGALLGLHLHRVLPRVDLSRETQDVVRLGTGMLSVLASLVLGLLIATAKTSFDTTNGEIRSYGADLILLAETFRDYGPQAVKPKQVLRTYTERVLAEDWPATGSRAPQADTEAVGVLLEHVREEIRALRPVDDGQRYLQNQMLEISTALLRQRWLLIEQDEPSVRMVIVAVLVAWITLIFVSFGMNAPRNAVVVSSMLICAMAIGGSVFLIMQLDRPFDGVMRVSSRPLVNALAHMQP